MTEPVAWMFRGYLYDTDPSDWTVHEHPNVPVIPLYTHPMLELTDEEIQDLWAEMNWSGHPELEFARAILRKASEK